MEKIWAELKKIENQAQKIRNEAQNKAKTLTNIAQQEADKLVANGKTYAEEEAHQYLASAIDEANRSRDEQLKASQQEMEKIDAQAEKRLEHASSVIMNAVLGETKP